MCTGSPELSRGSDDRTRVLVVDDDGEMRALLADVLSDEGYAVEGVANGAEALIRLRSQSFAAIVLDKNMPGLSGLDLLPGLRTICPETPIIMITAFGDVATYVDAMEKGAFTYIFKPFRMEELLRVLQRALPSAKRALSSPSTRGAMS
jgi:two-component system response regulator (stage 0 sporulation protein F)